MGIVHGRTPQMGFDPPRTAAVCLVSRQGRDRAKRRPVIAHSTCPNCLRFVTCKIKIMKKTAPAREFIENATIEWENVETGIQRKVMAYDEKIMLVKVKFETGGIGSLHKHHHSQITHVESGLF